MRLPYLLKYSDRVPYAKTNMFLIRVHPNQAWDRGLLAHEEEHVKQFWAMWLVGFLLTFWISPFFWIFSCTTHSLLYLLSSKYRLWAEVKAYRKQMQVNSNKDLETCAEYLATAYKLKLSTREAIDMIQYIK